MSTLAARYDAVAGSWGAKMARLGYAAAYRALVQRAFQDRRPAGRVLDIGTGTGTFAEALCSGAGGIRSVTLLDPSAAMLQAAKAALARRVPDLRLIRGETGTDALAHARFDTILCAHVIEHAPDPQAALRWMAGLLADGGVLLLVVSKPHWCTWVVRRIWGSQAFAPRTVLAWATAAGFADGKAVAFAQGPPSRTSCGYILTGRPDGALAQSAVAAAS